MEVNGAFVVYLLIAIGMALWSGALLIASYRMWAGGVHSYATACLFMGVVSAGAAAFCLQLYAENVQVTFNEVIQSI